MAPGFAAKPPDFAARGKPAAKSIHRFLADPVHERFRCPKTADMEMGNPGRGAGDTNLGGVLPCHSKRS